MKKINPKKLLPAPAAKNQSSFSQKLLVPASRVTVNDSAKVQDNISTPQQKELKEQSLSLKRKFISLTKLFGIKTNLERKKNKQKRIELEKERRQKREEEKETGKTTFSFGPNLPKLALPRVGFLDSIKRFLLYGLLGFAVDKIIPIIPSLLQFATKLQPAFEFFKTVASGIVSGIVGFIDSSYKAYDFVKGKIDEIIGPDRTDEFNEFTKNLNTVLNGALLAATAVAITAISKTKGPLGKSGLDKGRVGLALGAGAGVGAALLSKGKMPGGTRITSPIQSVGRAGVAGSILRERARRVGTSKITGDVTTTSKAKPKVKRYSDARSLVTASIGSMTESGKPPTIAKGKSGVSSRLTGDLEKGKKSKKMGPARKTVPNVPLNKETLNETLKRQITENPKAKKVFERFLIKKLKTRDPFGIYPSTLKLEDLAEVFETTPDRLIDAELSVKGPKGFKKVLQLEKLVTQDLISPSATGSSTIRTSREYLPPGSGPRITGDVIQGPELPPQRGNILERLFKGQRPTSDPTGSRIPSKLKKPPATPFQFLRGAASRNIFKGLLGPIIGGVLDFLLSVLFGDPYGLAAAGAIGATIGTAIGAGIGSLPPFVALGGPFIGGAIGGIGGDLFGRFLYEKFTNRKQTDERLIKLAEFLAAGDNKTAPAKALLPKKDEQSYFGVKPVLTSRYGEMRGNRPHLGTDIAAPTGTPLVAVSNGNIIDYGDLSRNDTKRGEPGGWGNFIVYQDIRGFYHLYAHLNTITKKSGSVKQGEQIATVGNTGRSSDPHLHWELGTGWTGSQMQGTMDPLSYYSVMSPFALKGGKRTANLASPNKNVASGLNDMTDYEQGGDVEIAIQPIVDKTLVPISASGGGDTVIALNSNAPSRIAPALIG